MTPPPPKHPRPASGLSRAQWVQRFGIYFLGIAIGLVIVGLLQSARQRAAQQPRIDL